MSRNKFFFILVFIHAISFCRAQFISPSSLTSGGSQTTSGTYSLDYTVGDMSAVGTFQNGNYILTQGFLQPEDLNVSAPIIGKSDFSIVSIYPNPLNEKANLNIYLSKPGSVLVSISSLDGKVIESKNYTAVNQGKNSLTLITDKLPVGEYVLTVQYNGNVQSIKFIKVN